MTTFGIIPVSEKIAMSQPRVASLIRIFLVWELVV